MKYEFEKEISKLKEEKQEMKYEFEKEKTQLLNNILQQTSTQLQEQTKEIIRTTLTPKPTNC